MHLFPLAFASTHSVPPLRPQPLSSLTDEEQAVRISLSLSYTRPWADCGFTTARKGDLMIHMRSHLQSYSCEEPGCAYTGRHNNYLTGQMLSHTCERPFACEEPDCGYTSIHKYFLTKHMRTHKGCSHVKNRAAGSPQRIKVFSRNICTATSDVLLRGTGLCIHDAV